MNICKNYQKMIKDFDKGNLSLNQEEQFINHIMDCEDCKEELEIYYIVSYGLDEDYNSSKIPKDIKNCIDSYDFKKLVDLKIEQSVNKCKAMRKWNHNMKLSYIMLELIMLMTLLMGIIIRYY